jgi:hypothetical protein
MKQYRRTGLEDYHEIKAGATRGRLEVLILRMCKCQAARREKVRGVVGSRQIIPEPNGMTEGVKSYRRQTASAEAKKRRRQPTPMV